jgi:hypothetical protein
MTTTNIITKIVAKLFAMLPPARLALPRGHQAEVTLAQGLALFLQRNFATLGEAIARFVPSKMQVALRAKNPA